MLLQATTIAQLCKGRVVRGGASARRVATDTRTMGGGDCFIALVGDRFDGHDFVSEAFARGAAGVVVSRPPPPASVAAEAFVVRVPDTLAALESLAAEYRSRHPAKVVGITGSCGKTSTKDMLGRVLAGTIPTVRSPKSFNNRVGVPHTLFLLAPDTRAAVVEIGSSVAGEVERLSRIAAPDIAIVTCVAEAHLSGLGSLGGVAREKAKLVAGLKPEGVAILNGDDEACRAMAQVTPARVVLVRLDNEADWFATEARFHGMGTTFLLQGQRPVTLPMLGTHSVYNALFTIAAAVELGMELEDVLEALCCLPPTSRRLEPKVVGRITIFDDTYNMNPASARAGLQALAGLTGKGRKLVVFGGMLELGERSEDLHHVLGEEVARSGVDLLLTVGDDARPIAEGARAAGMARGQVLSAEHVSAAEDALAALLGPEDMVLCKASRRFELDRLVDGLVARLEKREGSLAKPGSSRKPARRKARSTSGQRHERRT
jgi:UDP-N-acetylmuramoyl-tripeptide--D-alanyl-D-alanine ligase